MIGTRMMRDAEIGEDQSAEDLDGDFLYRIGGGAEAAREIAVEPMLDA